MTTLRGKDAFGVLVQAVEEDFLVAGGEFLFSQVSSLEGVCWNIQSGVASSTLGRNSLGMKVQLYRVSERKFYCWQCAQGIYK